MKFIAQNYAVLMGFEGCALMRPNDSKINGLTIQFAESAAFWDTGPGFGTHLTRKSDTMET